MGARGTLVLFRDLKEAAPLQVTETKGRSAKLIAERDECLVDRYHYYLNFAPEVHGHAAKLNYDSILVILQREFFINSEFTIPQILRECYERLHELKATKPDKSYFKKKWPHLVW
jgi:hypothetical protein